MRRLVLLTSIALCSLLVAGFGSITNSAEAAVSRMPIVLLVQRSYFVPEETGCRVDIDNQKQVLLKVNNSEGKRRGGVWFAKGETINATGPSGVAQMYCAFVKTAEVETTGEAELLLHNQYLTTVDLDEYASDTHIVLEIDDSGLVAEDIATPSEVTAMGLVPLESVETGSSGANSSETGVTRTTRASRSSTIPPTPTPEPIDRELGQGRQPDGTYKIVGFLELIDPDVVYRDGECYGRFGYSDIYEGKQFVIRDGDGRILGVGELVTLEASVDGYQCVYGFEMIVEESRFYVISSSDERGEIIYTHQELVEYDWIIWLTLGDD